MATYPPSPVPGSVEMALVMDARLVFETDSGIQLRRARHSRPRRRYTLHYLGQDTQQTRFVRDFLMQHRLGVVPFDWIHPTAFDTAAVSNTTPVILTYFHEYFTGQWVVISGSTPHTGLNNVWQITRLTANTYSLNGSSAGGAGTCQVRTYLPQAIGSFADDQMLPPVKLIGPESTNSTQGRFSYDVTVEEIF